MVSERFSDSAEVHFREVFQAASERIRRGKKMRSPLSLWCLLQIIFIVASVHVDDVKLVIST